MGTREISNTDVRREQSTAAGIAIDLPAGRQQASPELFATHSRGRTDAGVQGRERGNREMGSKKPKQPLARRDLPSSGLHGGSGNHVDNAERAPDQASGREAEAIEAIATESTARAAAIQETYGRLDSGDETTLTPKRYTPPNCSSCIALRPNADTSYVSVYHTKREGGFVFRYCKCSFCGNTFKHSEKQD